MKKNLKNSFRLTVVVMASLVVTQQDGYLVAAQKGAQGKGKGSAGAGAAQQQGVKGAAADHGKKGQAAQGKAAVKLIGSLPQGMQKKILAYGFTANQDLNAKSAEGTTPLCEAAENGDEDVVNVLLANGADPKVCTTDNVTPLHNACSSSMPAKAAEMIKALITAGASVVAPDSNGDTPLHYAVYAKAQLPIFKALLSKPGIMINVPNKNNPPLTPMAAAQINPNYQDVVQFLAAYK